MEFKKGYMMRKLGIEKLDKIMKESIGSDYLKQLGLDDFEENNDVGKEDNSKNNQPISNNVKTPTLEETLKLDLPIPTF